MSQQNLGRQLGSGLAWSTINSLVLRLGSFAVGVVIARILAPEQFGVFAVALTVQAVLMTLADLGMSADLIRSADPERIAPTVATLALASGTTLAITMALSGQGVADLLGSPDAGPVISVMAFSLLLAGAGVVPYASLQRRFAQKKLFGIAAADFIIGTALTIVLILAGWGVMGLACARIVSQSATLVLQFVLSGEKVRFGFDRAVAPAVLSFGVPVALANMLSWALLNVDNVAISRLSGPVALGFYFLAFNVSNWPMSAVGQVVRSVSIPTFSRLATSRPDRNFAVLVGPVWAISLLAGLLLSVLAHPVIELVYGPSWLPAAAVAGLARGLWLATHSLRSFRFPTFWHAEHRRRRSWSRLPGSWRSSPRWSLGYEPTAARESQLHTWLRLSSSSVLPMPCRCSDAVLTFARSAPSCGLRLLPRSRQELRPWRLRQ